MLVLPQIIIVTTCSSFWSWLSQHAPSLDHDCHNMLLSWIMIVTTCSSFLGSWLSQHAPPLAWIRFVTTCLSSLRSWLSQHSPISGHDCHNILLPWIVIVTTCSSSIGSWLSQHASHPLDHDRHYLLLWNLTIIPPPLLHHVCQNMLLHLVRNQNRYNMPHNPPCNMIVRFSY